MANKQIWSAPGSWQNIFGSSSSDLNVASFVNLASVIATAAYDNSSNLDLYCDISFQCTSISPSGIAAISFYILPQLADGSTYADGDGSLSTTLINQATQSCFAGNLMLRTKASSAQNGMLRQVVVPPGLMKFYAVNNSGVTLPSTGTVCQARFYSENNNG